MVTGKDPGRIGLAKVAVRCFFEQTHAEKELVIINDGKVALGRADPRVREITIPHNPRVLLGELRNLGLQKAKGDFVIQWDDDDWHHPRRIELQLANWERGAAVLLQNQIRYSFIDGRAILYSRRYGIHGTILHERMTGVRYVNRSKREDTWFLLNFSHRKVLESQPPLYIRFCHNANTWSTDHIMRNARFQVSGSQHELTGRERQLLDFVLQDYYGCIANQSSVR